MAAAAAPGMDLFEEYFKKADLDRDGRISGAEAVTFFQGSNLSKPVLAQVWMYADQNRTGYLGRREFYNALKLVTVAQSGRQLTEDIVKAALFGPAAAKIPAPKINLASSPAPQFNPVSTPMPSASSLIPPSNQFGTMTPNASQNLGTGVTQATQNVVATPQASSLLNINLMRPSQAGPMSTRPQMQGSNLALTGGSLLGSNQPISSTSNLSSGLLGNNSGGGSVAGMSQVPIRGATHSQTLDGFGLAHSVISTGLSSNLNTHTAQASYGLPSKTVDQAILSSSPVNNSRSLVLAGNGFNSDSSFGGDNFSNTQLKSNSSIVDTSSNILSSSNIAAGASETQILPKPGQLNSVQNNWSVNTPSNILSSSNIAAGTSETQNLPKPGQLNSIQNNWSPSSLGNQIQQTQSTGKQNQVGSSWMSSGLVAPSVSSGAVNSASNQSQLQWPKITQSDIKKYTKVFVDVDKDRDGKITGEQARNLFLSWKLPREVLKQVWDLSDQDSDSMLSLREFCIALYLMERYREGNSLPNVLPNTLMYDETLLRATTLPSAGFGGPAWQPGIPQQTFAGSGPVMPAVGVRPSMHNQVLMQTNGAVPLQPNSGVSSLENHTANRLGKQNQNTKSKHQEMAVAENKVQGMENKILDSREKIEFYRTKMQDLVFYKSRCDNRLNEITERASADKREVELLGKKYEERFKQVAEIASKLAVEDSKFRDIQERKTELHNAIIKMEQGGSADGLLQVRVDRLQSDLEELEKAFMERCKHHNLHVKATTSIELPSGWEQGPQEGALVWDENWDKFEDEGFTTTKDASVEVDAAATRNPMSASVLSDKASVYQLYPIDEENDEINGTEDRANESGYDHSEDGSTSFRSSPGRSAAESPFNTTMSVKHDTSPRTKERHSDQSGGESTFSGEKFSDEQWTFDDSDSVWGFNTSQTPEGDHFMSGDLRPVKVNSPSASSVFGNDRKRSFFDDSVPASPAFSTFNDRREEHSFNSFGRFDSFDTQDTEIFPTREGFGRFDSFSSNRPETFSRFDSPSSNRPATFSRSDSMSSTQPATFSRFDSMSSTQPATFSRFDSMSSSKPETFSMFDSMSSKEPEAFSRFDSMKSRGPDTFLSFDSMSSNRFDSTSTARPETFSRFDSMGSTREFGHSRFDSFDDADPFGSTGPFKASGSHSPRRDSDNWRAF